MGVKGICSWKRQDAEKMKDFNKEQGKDRVEPLLRKKTVALVFELEWKNMMCCSRDELFAYLIYLNIQNKNNKLY